MNEICSESMNFIERQPFFRPSGEPWVVESQTSTIVDDIDDSDVCMKFEQRPLRMTKVIGCQGARRTDRANIMGLRPTVVGGTQNKRITYM